MPKSATLPFFTAPGAASLPRRLLLISYHFPPAQAAGALRWQKLARHAAEHGYGLDVITLDPRSLAAVDDSRLQELPPGTRVYGIPRPHAGIESVEQAALQGLRQLRGLVGRRRGGAAPAAGTGSGNASPTSFSREEVRWRPLSGRDALRAYFTMRDHLQHRSWVRRAAAVGERLAAQRPYSAVVTCGPPHMAHEGGRLLSSRTGLPHVMDLRDPWSLLQRLPEVVASPLWLYLARRYERRALAGAALVVMNTPAACRAMQERYPEAAARIIAVLNGYDDDPGPASRRSERFTIVHAGSIYIDRNPRPLFRAAAQVVRELELGPEQFGIEQMGLVFSLQNLSVEEIAREEGIAEYVRLHPLRPRSEALEFLAGAALLVILPQDSDLAIPSKIFEYLQFDAWILALAHRGSAIETTFRDSPVDIVAPDDVPGLAALLRERYLQHAGGQRPARDPRSLERFSRRAQARILFDAFEERIGLAPVTASSPRPTSAAPLTAR